MERSRGAGDSSNLGQHVGLRGHVEGDRMLCGQPKLVEPAHVLRVGDRDPKRPVLEGERDRADALEYGKRDHPGRLRVDAGLGQIDERQVVLLGEPTRDTQ